jgi:hypothetical protein
VIVAIKILSYRAYSKNTLRAFIEAELPSGLVIRDLTLHEKNGRRWVSFPARQYQKDDGTSSWVNLVYFPDREKNDKFQELILDAVAAYLRAGGK